MLSADNPMRNRAVYRAAMIRVLSRQKPKNEEHFEGWLRKQGIVLSVTADGSFWIGHRNPDYRVPGQRKVLELTQKECFIGERRKRTPEGYGVECITHYRNKGWECLVIFKRDHRCVIPSKLKDVLLEYMSPESRWSGVWNFDELIPFGESKGA